MKANSYVDEGVLELAYVLIRGDRRDLMVSFDIGQRVAKLLVVCLGQRLVWVEETGQNVQKGSFKNSALVEIGLPTDRVPEIDGSCRTRA